VLAPDGFRFRLEGAPVEGALLEWVGYAGHAQEAREMARWLIRERLFAVVQVVEVLAQFDWTRP
jgi:hypothetical protein